MPRPAPTLGAAGCLLRLGRPESGAVHTSVCYKPRQGPGPEEWGPAYSSVAPAGEDLVSLLFTPKMVWVEAPFIRVGSAPERADLGQEGLPSCLNYETLPEEVDEKQSVQGRRFLRLTKGGHFFWCMRIDIGSTSQDPGTQLRGRELAWLTDDLAPFSVLTSNIKMYLQVLLKTRLRLLRG